MFIKLDNFIFNGDYKAEHIKMYILLLLNKPTFSNNISTNIELLNELYGFKDIKKNISKIKCILSYLNEMEIITINTPLENIKKKDKFKIIINELNYDGFMGFTKIEKADLDLTEKFTTNEFVLYFFIKRYYNESLGKAFCSYRFINESIGMNNKTAQNIIDMFCIMGIIQKYNPNYYTKNTTGAIRRSNNEYRNFTNTPKPYKTLIKFDDVDKDTYTKLKTSRLYNEVEHTCYLGFGKNRKVKDTFKFLIPRTNVS